MRLYGERILFFKVILKGIFAFYCCERLCKNRLNELIDACWGMMTMTMIFFFFFFFLFDCCLSVYMDELLEWLPFLCAYSKREYAHNLCSKIDRQMIMMWSIHDQVLSDRGSHNYFLSFFSVFFFFWEVGIKQLFWILISLAFFCKGEKRFNNNWKLQKRIFDCRLFFEPKLHLWKKMY